MGKKQKCMSKQYVVSWTEYRPTSQDATNFEQYTKECLTAWEARAVVEKLQKTSGVSNIGLARKVIEFT